METVTLDKTGKIYIPKQVQKKMKSKEYYILVMPEGNIVLQKIEHIKDPIKRFSGIWDTNKSAQQLKTEAMQTAEQEVVKDVRGHRFSRSHTQKTRLAKRKR